MSVWRSWRYSTAAWETISTGRLRCFGRWLRPATSAGKPGRGSMTTMQNVSGERAAVSGGASRGRGGDPAPRSPLPPHDVDVFHQMETMGHEQVLLSHDP